MENIHIYIENSIEYDNYIIIIQGKVKLVFMSSLELNIGFRAFEQN